MGLAPVLFASIHPVRNTVNTHERNRYHAPFICTYLVVSMFTSAMLSVSSTVSINACILVYDMVFVVLCLSMHVWVAICNVHAFAMHIWVLPSSIFYDFITGPQDWHGQRWEERSCLLKPPRCLVLVNYSSQDNLVWCNDCYVTTSCCKIVWMYIMVTA